jgi:hypothetical protein
MSVVQLQDNIFMENIKERNESAAEYSYLAVTVLR